MKIKLILLLNIFLLTSCSTTPNNSNGKSSLSIEEDSSLNQDVNNTTMTFLNIPQGTNPNEISAQNNLFIVNSVMRQKKFYKSILQGEAKGKILFINYTQNIFNEKTYNEGTIFTNSISSSSLKNIAIQRYLKEDSTFERQTSKIEDGIGNFEGCEIYKMSKTQYEDKYGYYPNYYTAYRINETTIQSIELIDQKEGMFEYKIVFNPLLACEEFKLEVATLGESPILPIYSKCEWNLTINERWEVQTISTYEVYKMKPLGIANIEITNTTVETFSYFDKSQTILEESEFQTN